MPHSYAQVAFIYMQSHKVRTLCTLHTFSMVRVTRGRPSRGQLSQNHQASQKDFCIDSKVRCEGAHPLVVL